MRFGIGPELLNYTPFLLNFTTPCYPDIFTLPFILLFKSFCGLSIDDEADLSHEYNYPS